jgi:putative ATPase
MTFDLFPGRSPSGGDVSDPGAPLAERMRPRSLEQVVGQEHLTAPDRLLGRIVAGTTFPSLIFWGPPGSGKTTLARILARAHAAGLVPLSAVTAGVKEIRRAVDLARGPGAGRRTVLFLDEIHRFNKAQQDALLPHVESGLLTLIGATTENPSFEVNAALLSRCRVLVLRELDSDALARVFDEAATDPERGLGRLRPEFAEGVRDALIGGADGDARRLLNALEIAVEIAGAAAGTTDGTAAGESPVRVTLDHVKEALQSGTLRYDRAGEEHSNLISALQKSVRASDPQAAVYWTQRMLAAGEDPLYVARRLVRMAVEDVGLADPGALPQAMAAQQAVHFLGLPEGGAALLQAAVYLALAPKSNRIVVAEARARETIEKTGSLPVPLAFRNPVTGLMDHLGYGKGYVYDHDAPGGHAGQDGLPDALRGTRFFEPSPRGFEKDLGERMKTLEGRRAQGTTSEGAANEGTANEGTTNEGAANEGSADDGSADEGWKDP